MKLNITKAFDTVDWSFLLEVLRNMGFGERLLACICALLSTASTRVLLNGSPGARITNRRGLRQGDPLSPQLFILVMEVLHYALEKATQEGHLAHLAVSGLRQHTSIYANDVVTFLRPRVEDLRVFAVIIDDFGATSGLRTNLSKCSAHLIRCLVEVGEMVVQELGCPVLPFPMRYLGLPLGLRKPTVAQLQYLVEAVANRLPG
jgi:mannosylglycoprotein endo-beta-mannosidase